MSTLICFSYSIRILLIGLHGDLRVQPKNISLKTIRYINGTRYKRCFYTYFHHVLIFSLILSIKSQLDVTPVDTMIGSQNVTWLRQNAVMPASNQIYTSVRTLHCKLEYIFISNYFKVYE